MELAFKFINKKYINEKWIVNDVVGNKNFRHSTEALMVRFPLLKSSAENTLVLLWNGDLEQNQTQSTCFLYLNFLLTSLSNMMRLLCYLCDITLFQFRMLIPIQWFLNNRSKEVRCTENIHSKNETSQSRILNPSFKCRSIKVLVVQCWEKYIENYKQLLIIGYRIEILF